MGRAMKKLETEREQKGKEMMCLGKGEEEKGNGI